MNKETKENNIRINENGITLIALIITIIVLLILAGVSINLIIGENGIIKQAKDATTMYAQKEQEEKTALDNLYEEYLGHINDITVETAPANEINNWDYTLDTDNKNIYLTKYKGTGEDLTVYGKYEVDGVTYNTILNSTDRETSPFYNTSIALKSIVIKNGVTSESCTYMFYQCGSLTTLDLSGLNTSNVTNMFSMFEECINLTNLNLSNFDTSKVTNMSYMFENCYSLTTLDLSNFNTSNVTAMNNMFEYCDNLTTLDLSGFDTSKVTDMGYMFNDCFSLTSLNLSTFNTSNVWCMAGMFYNCNNLTSLDLSGFDTSTVTDMCDMFSDCTDLTTIYVTQDKWVTSQADTTDMFLNCGTSNVTYKE